MSIAELATELILEITSHIGSDDCGTLLHFALVNKYMFTIVMPKVISAQSARIKSLTKDYFKANIMLNEAEDGRCEEEPTASYTSYWLHEDCRGNVFARAYNLISLFHDETTPAYMYGYMYALIKRVRLIDVIILDLPWWEGFDYDRMGKILELCVHKVPPPHIVVYGVLKSNPNPDPRFSWKNGPFYRAKFVRDHAHPGPHFKKRKLPLRMLNSITQKLTGMEPFLPIQLPQDNRPMPRQPPRVSTKPYYSCGYMMPTFPLSVAPSPTLQCMHIRSQTMFMPSLYPYTVNLLNLAPLTTLIMSDIDMCPEAWSQILYALKIPTLQYLNLDHLRIFFLDVMFFLQRHQAITRLSLLIDLLPVNCPEETKFPAHFDLPCLETLEAPPEYAVTFFDAKQRLLNLERVIVTASRSPDLVVDLSPMYNYIATHSAQLELNFHIPLEQTGFVKWAVTSGTTMTGVSLFCTQGAAQLGQESIQHLTDWCELHIDAHRWFFRNVSSPQLLVGNLIFTVCPNAIWKQKGPFA